MRTPRRLLVASALALSVALLPAPAAGDRVVLKNGRVLDDVAVAETPEGIRIGVGGGELLLPHGQVVAIEKASSSVEEFAKRATALRRVTAARSSTRAAHRSSSNGARSRPRPPPKLRGSITATPTPTFRSRRSSRRIRACPFTTRKPASGTLAARSTAISTSPRTSRSIRTRPTTISSTNTLKRRSSTGSAHATSSASASTSCANSSSAAASARRSATTTDGNRND